MVGFGDDGSEGHAFLTRVWGGLSFGVAGP